MPDTPSDVAMRLAEIADHVTLNTEPCPSHERQRYVAHALDAAGVAEAVAKLERMIDDCPTSSAAAALAALRGENDEK